MAKYGGFGGIEGGRKYDPEDLFEATIQRLFGERMRREDRLCEQVWSALANIVWMHDSGDTASYSFRAAGDLIAAIRGSGDYLDWYCSGPYETVTSEIAEAMAAEGWGWRSHRGTEETE